MLRDAGLWSDSSSGSARAWLLNVIELIRPRAHRLGDFVEIGRPFFTDAFEFDPGAVQQHLSSPDLAPPLAVLRDAFSHLERFDEDSLEPALRNLAAARGMKAGTLIHAVRVAVTGRAVSPGLFEVLALIGRARTLARLEQAERRLTAAAKELCLPRFA